MAAPFVFFAQHPIAVALAVMALGAVCAVYRDRRPTRRRPAIVPPKDRAGKGMPHGLLQELKGKGGPMAMLRDRW